MSGIIRWGNKGLPQNLMIARPVTGGMIIAAFSLVFSILYRPLGVHASGNMNYVITMLVYSILAGMATVISILILKRLKWFSDAKSWNILKEFMSVMIVLAATGIFIYIAGFFLEPPSNRFKISTVLDSVSHFFLFGIIPFTFFSVINYMYLFPGKPIPHYADSQSGIEDIPGKEPVRISSQLKKESLSFFPDELLYAESDGNYVVFWLQKEKQLKKEIIRNSINNVEQQLSGIPFLLRTHRAFIVNLKKVTGRNGTSLGYRLKLDGTDNRIPVSRNNIKKFNEILAGYMS